MIGSFLKVLLEAITLLICFIIFQAIIIYFLKINNDSALLEANGVSSSISTVTISLIIMLSSILMVWLIYHKSTLMSGGAVSFLGFMSVPLSYFLRWFFIGCAWCLLLYFFYFKLDISFKTPFIDKVDSGKILFFIACVFFAPLWEELMFRGYLYKKLIMASIRPEFVILVTSVLWMLIHFQYGAAEKFLIFFMGVVLGFVRYKTNSVIVSLAIHCAVNSSAITFSFMEI